MKEFLASLPSRESFPLLITGLILFLTFQLGTVNGLMRNRNGGGLMPVHVVKIDPQPSTRTTAKKKPCSGCGERKTIAKTPEPDPQFSNPKAKPIPPAKPEVKSLPPVQTATQPDFEWVTPPQRK